MTYLKTLAVASLALAMGLTAVRASEPAGQSRALTHESLKKMLEDLGYESQPTKSTTGNPMNVITIRRDNLSFGMYVNLSPDATNLWLMVPLVQLPTTGTTSAADLEKLLALSDELAPAHFELKGRRIYLCLPATNDNIAPKRLRTLIDTLASDVAQTREHWQKLQTKDPVVPKS